MIASGNFQGTKRPLADISHEDPEIAGQNLQKLQNVNFKSKKMRKMNEGDTSSKYFNCNEELQ
jgi:hypothetical protein